MKDTFTDIQSLLRYLTLEKLINAEELLYGQDTTFPIWVPKAFADRMKKGDPKDPLLLQVLPIREENQLLTGYTKDPLKEQSAICAPGLIHRYHSRALWLITGACAVNCRYCFRRHFPYQKQAALLNQQKNWSAILGYLSNHQEISEIILSGGDPLIAKDDYLARLVKALEAIPHIQRLRVHTRIPVVSPKRVNPSMISWLCHNRFLPVVVIHCNHPNEIDASVAQAIALLRQQGVMLFNQSVLLKGVNDSVKTLVDLSHALFKIGVVPYYLHQLDPVQGAGHFLVEDTVAKALMKAVSAQLPGYLTPRLVRDEPGSLFKPTLL